jgi:oligosaccharide repeat unit polymerase
MISIVLWVIPFVLLVWLNYHAGGRDVLYPGFLCSALWGVTFCLYLTAPIPVNIVRHGTVAFILGLVILFSGLCWLACHTGLTSIAVGRPKERTRRWIYFLWGYSIVMLPIFWLEIQRISGASGFNPTVLISARLAINEAVISGGTAYANKFVSSAPTVALFTALLCLIQMPRHWLTRLACVNAMLLGFLTGGRPYILGLGVGSAYILISRRSERRFWHTFKKSIIGGTAFLVILTFGTFLTKEEVRGSESGTSVAMEYAYMYIAGGVPVLDYILHSRLVTDDIRDVITHEKNNAIFVWVPFPTNVFTAPGDYYLRYGIVGSVAIFSLLGGIHGWLYANFKQGKEWALFLSAVSMYPLAISTFSDQYVGTYTRYAFAVIFWLIYVFFSRRGARARDISRTEQPAI